MDGSIYSRSWKYTLLDHFIVEYIREVSPIHIDLARATDDNRENDFYSCSTLNPWAAARAFRQHCRCKHVVNRVRIGGGISTGRTVNAATHAGHAPMIIR